MENDDIISMALEAGFTPLAAGSQLSLLKRFQALASSATLLAAQTVTREREYMRSLVERHQAEARSYREAYHQLLEQMATKKAREPIPAAIFILQPNATLEDVDAAWAEPSSIAPKPLTR